MKLKRNKPVRRTRKQLSKYGLNHMDLREGTLLAMSEVVEVDGGRAVDNFKRYKDNVYVPVNNLIHNNKLGNDGELEVTFNVLPVKRGKGKAKGGLDIKITNIRKGAE